MVSNLRVLRELISLNDHLQCHFSVLTCSSGTIMTRHTYFTDAVTVTVIAFTAENILDTGAIVAMRASTAGYSTLRISCATPTDLTLG
jgi:hypothetical protein